MLSNYCENSATFSIFMQSKLKYICMYIEISLNITFHSAFEGKIYVF